MAKTNALTDWLGIPPGEQPPHYYRLLGLKLFTSDRGKIDAAAEKTINRVRKLAGENHKAVAAKLIGMIDTARSCLLNAEYKSAYDNQLRASGGIAPTAGRALPEPMELNQVIKSDKSRSTTASRKKSSSIIFAAAGGVVVALSVYVFAFSGWFGGEEEDEPIPGGQQLASNNEVTPPQSNPPESEPPLPKPVDQTNPTTVPNEANPPIETIVEPPPTDNGTTTTNGNSVSTNTDTTQVGSPVMTPVNLLELIDPEKHTIAGEWTSDEESLSSTGVKLNVVTIPFSPPSEYELHLTATRLGASRLEPLLNIGLVGKEQHFEVLLDWQGSKNGLERLDDKPLVDNETFHAGRVLKDGVPAKIVCRVSHSGVVVTVDGTTIVDWKGSFSRLSQNKQRPVSDAEGFRLRTESPYRFTQIQLLPLATPKPALRVVNLLKQIDPQRNAISGKWALEDGVLMSGGGKHSRLLITNDAPQKYELRLSVTRTGTMSQASWFQVDLNGGGSQFSASLDYSRGWISGLSMADGKSFAGRPGDSAPHLKIGVESQVVYRVDENGVKVTIDGKPIIDWTGDFSNLSIPPVYKLQTNKQLAIGSRGPFKISKIELRSLDVSQPPPTPRVVNLLRRIDPQLHSIAGKWTQDGAALVNHGGNSSRLQIPFSPPEEYQLNITATQLSAKGGLIVGLVAGGRQFTAIFDFRERYSGLHILDGVRGIQDNESVFDGRLLKQGVPIEIVCKVQKSGVSLAVNGRTIVNWKGEFSRLSTYDIGGYSIPNKTQLFIGGDSPFRFSKIELRRLAVPRPLPQPKPRLRVVNLLKKVDLKRNAISGSWTFENGVLLSGGGNASHFRITDEAPKEYELRLTVTRTGTVKQANWFGVILAGRGRLFSLTVDDSRGWTSGLQMIDGKLATANETTRQAGAAPLLKIGVKSQIVCRVDGKGVMVSVNGMPIIDWKGDFSRLSPHRGIVLKTPNHLGIGSASPFKISKIELRQLGAAASVPSDREAIPEIAAQQKATKLIRELFKKEYANLKRVTEKSKLAGKLLDQGQTSDDDPAARYVLLQEAKRLAIDAGDTALTMDAVDSIVWHFDVDPSTEKMAVLRKLAGTVRFPANGKAVAEAAFVFAKSTHEAGQFETSLEFLKMAGSTATKFRQRPLAKEILDFRRKIIAQKQRDDDAAEASQTLADNPDDPKANLVWGSYLCFIKQDWTAGLPLLAKSDIAGLKAVVKLEIAAPTDAKQMQAVADAWWNLAQQKKTGRIPKSQWLTRAGHWYDEAVGELTGLQKTLVEKRIKEIAATTSNVER